MDQASHRVHILFDLSQAGHVPAQAPVLAIQSKFLTRKQTGKVVAVGNDVIPQVLAQVASSVTGVDILFFPLEEAALLFLRKPE